MSSETPDPAPAAPIAIGPLSTTDRYLILIAAFLGWFFGGFHLAITQLAGQPAAIDLLAREGSLDAERYLSLSKQALAAGKGSADGGSLSTSERKQLEQEKALVGRWYAWYQCALLFGAATGGLVFGRLGDLFGRTKGMALSIFTYTVGAAVASFSQSPGQLLVLWFLACLGVGGVWPNGVALLSEAWSSLSRPLVAGVIGTAANIGIFVMAWVADVFPITPQSWRWALLLASTPMILGIFCLVAVAESPRWLATRSLQSTSATRSQKLDWEIFRPPLLRSTLLGILLATIPLLGGWGTAGWMIPWADEAGSAATPPDPSLKARVLQARSLTGLVGSLLGGWIGHHVGRRLSYFLVSLLSLILAQAIFWFIFPTDRWFLLFVSALGFVSGIYFGWLPLFLPELFPTRSRSTGAGVSFNFGRIVTAGTIFATGALMAVYGRNYALIGRITSLLFIVGMVAIWFAPDTSSNELKD